MGSPRKTVFSVLAVFAAVWLAAKFLLPLLSRMNGLEAHEAFACSVCIILPLSLVSVAVYLLQGGLDVMQALPYLAGGAAGGVIAGLLLKRISVAWLHRALGLLIVWGGLRLLLR